MKIENISVALLSYFESQLMPQIPSSLGKAMTYAGLLLKMPEVEQMLKQYAHILTDANGDVDLQKLHNIGAEVFNKIPKIDIADFDFDRNDFENLMSFLSSR